MDKISVLICGKDSFYNEMLAMALVKEHRGFSVKCTTPEMLAIHRQMSESFDIILTDEESNTVIPLNEKHLIMYNKTPKENACMQNVKGIYKYQSIKAIVAQLLKAHAHKCSDSAFPLSEEISLLEEGKARLIGVSGESNEPYGCLAWLLADCLSFLSKKTLLLDMREKKNDARFSPKKIGNRSWDDFIYCCTYGRSEEIFERPEAFASSNQAGCLFFENKDKHINPFSALDSDEVTRFYTGIRKKLNSDYVISILPENDSPGFYDNEAFQNLIILVNEKYRLEESRSRFVRERMESKKQYKGVVTRVCLGDKEVFGSDFFVFHSLDIGGEGFEWPINSRTWADAMKVAGYIDEYRFR